MTIIFISFFIIIFSLLFFFLIESLIVFIPAKKTIQILNTEGFSDLSNRLKLLTDEIGIVPIKGYSSEKRKEWYNIWKEIKNLQSKNSYLKKLSRRLSVLHLLKYIYIFLYFTLFVVVIIYLIFLTSM